MQLWDNGAGNMRHVVLFWHFVEAIRQSHTRGLERELEDAMCGAYEEAACIRDMSLDDKWKTPCDRFRTAFRAVSIDELLAVGSRLVSDLPSDAELVPLNYEPTVVLMKQ